MHILYQYLYVLYQALLNLGSTDAGLRVAAYKLLSGVKQAFHLRISYQLESSHGMSVYCSLSADYVCMGKFSCTQEHELNDRHIYTYIYIRTCIYTSVVDRNIYC